MAYWNQFTKTYFNETGEINFSLRSSQSNASKNFKIVNSLIPRFFWQQYDAFVNHITLMLEGTSENLVAENFTVVSTERAEMRLSYREGYQVSFLFQTLQ
jgi:hypothetical protein